MTEAISLFIEEATVSENTEQLAKQFPLILQPPGEGFYLHYSNDGLALCQAGPRAPGPVQIDFVSGKLGHRLRFGGGRGQPLARAVGIKAGFTPSIWDATAGLGRDAFVLASLGCDVRMSERSPILVALLDDALQRAVIDDEAEAWISQRLHLKSGDAIQLLAALTTDERPDVVYMDPMYPEAKGHVLVKKEMRALQQILAGDPDADQLLEVALSKAQRRVVVKRPKRAEHLAGKVPSASVESKNTRYDIYVTL